MQLSKTWMLSLELSEVHTVGKTNAVVFDATHTISIALVQLVNSSYSSSGDIKQKTEDKQSWLLGKSYANKYGQRGHFWKKKEDCLKLCANCLN